MSGALTFHVYLLWDTEPGPLAVAYPVIEGRGGGRAAQIRQFHPGIHCLVTVASQGFQAPDGPDVVDQAIEKPHNSLVLWRYYARAIGQPAPYWPWDLSYRDLIAQWRPGNATVIAVPTQNPDMTPLLRMAALYAPGSPTHRVLMHYYKVMCDAASGSVLALQCFHDPEWTHAFKGLADKLVLGARAVDVPDPGDLEDLGLDEHALRAVFSGLLERQDPLAVQVIEALRQWGATQHMPFATDAHYELGHMALLDEWRGQWDEVPGYLPDPRFAGMSSERDRVGRRFVDRATGAPVLEIRDWRDEVEAYYTLVPRRLPATTPLAELIIDGGGQYNWVRTADGTLYPAPAGNYGVSWGYAGSGYGPLVERLLDDINTPPLDRWIDPAHNGLTTLTRQKVPNGTVLTRVELEAARARRTR